MEQEDGYDAVVPDSLVAVGPVSGKTHGLSSWSYRNDKTCALSDSGHVAVFAVEAAFVNYPRELLWHRLC